jgi:beta-mannosidase
MPKTVKARVSLKDADQVIKQDIISLEGVTDMLKEVTKWGDLNVEKWWPVGYGKQQLYNVEIELLGADDVVLDRVSHKVGFRTIELIQTPLVEADYHGQGTSFYFREFCQPYLARVLMATRRQLCADLHPWIQLDPSG